MPSVQELVDQGCQALEQGDTKTALACFQQATEQQPDHAQAWYCLGTIFGQRKEYREAIRCYASSAKTAGERAGLPLFNMGNAYQELGELDKALQCFELACQAAPDMADAWINRGRLLDDAGEHRFLRHRPATDPR
jgi:tetratricopeptide (TPR) repeat protein